MTNVHLLRHGFPVCGFTREIPALWPDGHVFVSVMDTINLHQVNCVQCKAQIKKEAEEKRK